MTDGAPPCPFCEIVEREDPDAREVYRDRHVVAFFPTEPAVLGHTIVVPRRHVPDIWSVDEAVTAPLALATVRLARAIKEALEPDGLNVIQSNGTAATQTVFHLHVHIVPRLAGDAIGPIWPKATAYSEAEKDDAQTKVRNACRHLEAR